MIENNKGICLDFFLISKDLSGGKNNKHLKDEVAAI